MLSNKNLNVLSSTTTNLRTDKNVGWEYS